MFKLTVSSKKSASITSFAQYLYNEDILVLNCILYQTVYLCFIPLTLFFCTCIVHFEQIIVYYIKLSGLSDFAAHTHSFSLHAAEKKNNLW